MSEVKPSEKTMQYFKEWSEKIGVPIEEMVEQYKVQYEYWQKRHPGKSADFYDNAARSAVYVHFKGRRFTRAKPWDGVFVGVGPAMDVTARQREQALEILRTDPERAYREGWVNENGEPIDMRKTLPNGRPNPFYGRVLQPTFIRQSVFLGRPATGGSIKLGILHHFRDQAMKIPPLGTPVRFLANLRADEANRYILNTSVATEYEPIKMAEFPSIDQQTICNLLLNAPSEFRCNCSELEDWHNEHADDVRRICIVEGQAVFVRRAPLPTGNYFFVLEDETIMDIEGEGIMVWVHKDLEKQLEFGAGSRVVVIGRTVLGPGFDRETRTIDRSQQRIMINAFGIWPEPEFLIPVEEETVIEAEEVGA